MIAPEMLLAALERCGAAAAVLSFNNTATSTLQGATLGTKRWISTAQPGYPGLSCSWGIFRHRCFLLRLQCLTQLREWQINDVATAKIAQSAVDQFPPFAPPSASRSSCNSQTRH